MSSDPTEEARENIRGAIADVVLGDLDSNGQLGCGDKAHRTVDVLFQLSWALSAIEREQAQRHERALRSA